MSPQNHGFFDLAAKESGKRSCDAPFLFATKENRHPFHTFYLFNTGNQMGSLLQFREQKVPWYDRTTICILTCLVMAWLFWFGWVGIQLALEKGHASYLFTPVIIAFGAFYIFVKTLLRLRKRWLTYQKFKSM